MLLLPLRKRGVQESVESVDEQTRGRRKPCPRGASAVGGFTMSGTHLEQPAGEITAGGLAGECGAARRARRFHPPEVLVDEARPRAGLKVRVQ